MQEVISSSKNPRIKNIEALLRSKKDRSEQGLFVIEGLRSFKDAMASAPDLIEEIYLSEELAAGGDAEALTCGRSFWVVKDSVFTAMSDTVTPQGVLAVVRQPACTAEDLLQTRGRCRLLLLEDIQDPGNLGTMVRTAEAAGMTGIIMSRGTADIFSPKVIRATMGAVLRVPFAYCPDMPDLLDRLKGEGFATYAAYLHGGRDYGSVEYSERAALLIGNEGSGLKAETVEHATDRVFIPMQGRIESLNAAVAAALLMYKAGEVK